MNNIIEELNWRGLIKQITNEDKILKAQIDHKGVYCGFDPTADSLHVGHLIPIILLERFRQFGFKPVALIGGGTGMIGDPSFKSNERVLQTDEQVKKNSIAIEKQLKKFIPNVSFKNNATWLNQMSLIDFLREVGKDFTLGYLLAKDSIQSRIETGLSVTEFSYTMLQAYDFYQLYKNADTTVQIGGSDQWGNITSGTDYIASRIGKNNSQASGLTIQLLTKKDGKKFGKTESGAIWLDANKTSEYEFYQFFINQDDEDVEHFLKFMTFLTKTEIEDLVKQHGKQPSSRLMQKTLAKSVTKFVHGEEGYQKAMKLTEAFFNGSIADLNTELINIALQSIPTVEIESNLTAIEIIIQSKAASSKREAREFIQNQSISFNNIVITDENQIIDSKFFSTLQNLILVKRGKKKYFAAKIKQK